MKKNLIAFALAFILGLYPTAGMIVKTDYDSDTFTVKTPNGYLWECSDIEDFEVGDVVAMIMSDNGTEMISDDSILDVRYVG